ncbi:Arc family DNA-binding protein [Granulibacter bethesdensis]|uniref:Arc family DNA-binding protein n=1 Tax=Granulibacter bethesdensis TaxID=364410 RepID=UPI0004B59C71|nr:Arc family DNA-binding protein [Granulibacter bethesdensis]
MAKTDQIHLRLPPDLKSRLEAEATKENRSLNAEIVQRLQGSFEEIIPTYFHTRDIARRFEEMIQSRMDNMDAIIHKAFDEYFKKNPKYKDFRENKHK